MDVPNYETPVNLVVNVCDTLESLIARRRCRVRTITKRWAVVEEQKRSRDAQYYEYYNRQHAKEAERADES